MWLIVLFDLPTSTTEDRRNYTAFRKFLKKDGFSMLQFSVYARSCPSEQNAVVHVKKVNAHLPPEGQVRILKLTDQQYERQSVFWGKKRRQPEKPPAQLELF